MITHQKVVRAFGTEKQVQERFDDVNEKLAGFSLRAVFFSSLTNPATRFVNALVYACVGVAGAVVAITTAGAGLSVGALSAFLSYANQYTKPFNEISGVVTELQGALACARRVFELMEEPSEPEDVKPIKELTNVDGKVKWQDVSFSYVPDPLIQHFNLPFRPGSGVAIVGPTALRQNDVDQPADEILRRQRGKIQISGQCIIDVDALSRETTSAWFCRIRG